VMTVKSITCQFETLVIWDMVPEIIPCELCLAELGYCE
jgi:hypothetical protein